MKLYDFTNNKSVESDSYPNDFNKEAELFILCKPKEVTVLKDIFGFDESTVRDCTDLDESVRYSSFEGYDFISMVHIETLDDDIDLREINVYVSASYLVIVMPEHESARLAALERKLIDTANFSGYRQKRISFMYYLVYHGLLIDFSDMLETLEDRIQELSEEIVASVNTSQFTKINDFRNMTFSTKKQMRALSYLGDQILLDENMLVCENHINYFRSVATRLKKLYDFAENLYNLCGEMLSIYDSRLTMRTNDTVNKLAAITLFFGPLTVITGIYGMNFDFMPELQWHFGYPVALSMMIAVSVALFIILKIKNWL